MRTFKSIIDRNELRLGGLRAAAVACTLALGAVLPTISAAQQQTGLQTYYRTTNPNGQAPPTGWTTMPTAGVPVTLPAGGSVWIGAVNSERDEKSKTFQALIYVGLGVTGSTSCTVTGVKGDGTASTNTSKNIKPYYYWWNVRVTFTPQPAWEHIRIKNTSNQSVTIRTLRVDRISAWCKQTERSGGSDNGPQPRIAFSNATFGAEGAMFNNTRITEIEIFPRNAPIDRDEAPAFSAPQETGNWVQEFVAVDPDNEARPLGGVRFVSDGPGLEAGQEFDIALSMINLADSVYDIFAFDADANAYQRIYVDDGGTPWWENFDDDPPDIGLHGRRGWKGWDDDPAFDAPVSEAQSRSPLNSVDIAGASDIVREFAGVNEGRWSFSAWQYIPSDFVSGGRGRFAGSHFLLLNTYDSGGPYHWSVDVQVDSRSQSIKVYHGDGLNTIDVPYVTDRWVKIQAVIDLDNDWTQIYYDDALITEYTWTGGILGEGGGALDIAVIDLFANGSSSVYYDDLRLEPIESPFLPAELTDLQILDGEILGGGLEELRGSDDQYLHIKARVTGEAAQAHLLRLHVGAFTEVQGPAGMAIAVESRITDISATATILLRDWDTGEMIEVEQFEVSMAERVHRFAVADPTRFVRPGDGRIEMEIKEIVLLPFTLDGFQSFFDRVLIDLF